MACLKSSGLNKLQVSWTFKGIKHEPTVHTQVSCRCYKLTLTSSTVCSSRTAAVFRRKNDHLGSCLSMKGLRSIQAFASCSWSFTRHSYWESNGSVVEENKSLFKWKPNKSHLESNPICLVVITMLISHRKETFFKSRVQEVSVRLHSKSFYDLV